MKRISLSTILAPIVAENARRAALQGPKPEEKRRHYSNIQPMRTPTGEPIVAPYDAN